MKCELLKEERKKKGYTQEYMAKEIGYKDKSSYCLIEKGKVKVSAETAGRISAILELPSDVTYLIFFT